MSACPDCRVPLTPLNEGGKIFYVCGTCGGQAVTLPGLKRVSGAEAAGDMWRNSRPAPAGKARACPECARVMAGVFAAGGDDLQLEVCRRCFLFWFDRGELEQLPHVAAAAALPAEARKALAMARLAEIGAEAKSKRQRQVLETLAGDYEYNARHRSWSRGYDGWDAAIDVIGALTRLFR